MQQNRGNIVPKHIAIIMDGNGRWAKKRLLPRMAGHREGANAVRKIITHAASLNLKYLSMFTFSTENFDRPTKEVQYLMKLLQEYLETERKTIISNNISFIASGKLDRLPDKTQDTIQKLREDSSSNTGMVLNLAISYSGKDEILDATKAIATSVLKGDIKVNQINQSLFNDYLYNPMMPDIDLLIRTSGENRISNFMLWQLAYSEMIFTDKLWPDFNETDFNEAVIEFSQRVRRYGKVDE